MNTLTKSLLAAKFEAQYPKKTQKQARAEVDFIYDTIFAELKAGNKVMIDNVGSLSVVPTNARMGRNPKTGEAVQIPAGKRVKLSVSSTLKKALK